MELGGDPGAFLRDGPAHGVRLLLSYLGEPAPPEADEVSEHAGAQQGEERAHPAGRRGRDVPETGAEKPAREQQATHRQDPVAAVDDGTVRGDRARQDCDPSRVRVCGARRHQHHPEGDERVPAPHCQRQRRQRHEECGRLVGWKLDKRMTEEL